MRLDVTRFALPSNISQEIWLKKIYTNAACFTMISGMNHRLAKSGLFLAWVGSLIRTALAGLIQLRLAQVLPFNGSLLGCGTTFGVPCVADRNRDGREDLLVGCQSASKDKECKLPDNLWRLNENPFKFTEHIEGEARRTQKGASKP